MKDISSQQSGARRSIRETIASIAVLGIVLVVPVFSIVEFGRVFRGNDSRSSAPLPAMVQREADTRPLPPQLFTEPLITVSFDDGYQSIYKSALPLLQKYGIRSTQYVLSGTSDQADYVSWDQIAEMQAGGHEIACHTVDHSDLTTLGTEALNVQLAECRDELSKRYGPVEHFASPYGASNEGTMAAIRNHYFSHRNTNGDPANGADEWDVNLPATFDRYSIVGVTVRSDTKLSDLQALVEYTRQHNAWLVLTYHQADDGGSQFGVNPRDLEKQFAYLSKTDIRIVTIGDALKTTRIESGRF